MSASCHCHGSLKCGLRSSCLCVCVCESERVRERERIAFHFGGLELGSHGVCGAESGVVVLCKGGRLAFF